jgi:hypothetical protein
MTSKLTTEKCVLEEAERTMSLELEFDYFGGFLRPGLEGAFLSGFLGGCCEKRVSAQDTSTFHGAVWADGHLDAYRA